MIEMAVQTVARARNRALIAVLREAEGHRVLGVGLGRAGAAAVQCGLRNVRPIRPLVWSALVRAVEALGGRVARTVIDVDAGNHPQGFIDVNGPAGVLEIPCSTEDCVAVACLAGCPVVVRPSLIGRRRPWRGPA